VLDRLRRLIRRVSIWDGLVWIGVLLVVAAILSFSLDYFLRLPRGVRTFFMFAGVAGAIVVVFRSLLTPLSRRLSDEQLAMLIEETHPGMRQTLITAIQLARPDSRGGRYISSELLDSVVRDVESQVSTIAPSKVLHLGRMRRNLVWLVGLTVAISVVGLFQPRLVSIWFQRNVLLAAVAWPKATEIELDPSTPLTVAMGDDLTISVRVLRGSPRSADIEWALDQGGRRVNSMDLREDASRDVYLEEIGPDQKSVSIVLEKHGLLSDAVKEVVRNGAGRIAYGLPRGRHDGLETELRQAGAVIRVPSYEHFVYEFRNVSQAFRFWVQCDDDSLGGYDGIPVEVRLRPRIDMTSIELEYQLPKYTGAGDQTLTQKHGNIKAPVGTRVNYRMATNIDVERAFFVLRTTVDTDESAGAKETWPDPGAVALDLSEKRRFSGSFVVESSGYYYFQFEDDSQFRSVQPERFRVQAIADRDPIVRITEPNRPTEEISPTAEVPIVVNVQDDYAVRNVALEIKYQPAGATEQEIVRGSEPLLETPSGDPRDAKADPEIETFVLDVASLVGADGQKPAPGARIEFHVNAEDFGEAEGASPITNPDGSTRPRGNIGFSESRVLHVVDPEYLEEEFTREMMIFRDMAGRLKNKQESVRKDLQETLDSVEKEPAFDAEDAPRFARHRQDQSKVTEGIDNLAKQMNQLLAKMEANKVGEQKWKDWIRGLEEELSSLAERSSKGVEGDLDSLRKKLQESKRDPSEIAPLLEKQRDIERELSSLVVRMTEFGDLRGLIQLMREVKRRQEGIREGTKPLVSPGTPDGHQGGEKDQGG